MSQNKITFLSAVSDEFHKTDPNRPQGFLSYRRVLAEAFRRLGPDYPIITQEDLAQGPGDLLETLDVEISRSDLVIHLVGDLAGESPAPASVRALKERHPDLFHHQPELASKLTEPLEPSFTQWELYLAYEHRKGRLVYRATSTAPRSPFFSKPAAGESQAISQDAHCARWKATGEHYEWFSDQNDLAIKAITSAVRFGYGPAGGYGASLADAIQAARRQISELVREICNLLRRPNRHAVPALDPAGVADFLHAVDTVALRRELNRRDTLQLVEEFREQKRDRARADPTPENFLELAFTELASGRYRDAMQEAQEAANAAVREIKFSPDDESRREVAMNAFMLLHDAAKAARDVEKAIAAQENAGKLIDKGNSPVSWANLYQTLARDLLDHGRYPRAAELVSEILDIREEQQDDRALAEALLLWAGLLGHEGDYGGQESVSARAARLFSSLVLPDMLGFSAAIGFQGQALHALGNYLTAEPLMRRALEICEQSYGKDHPNVAIRLNDLAQLLESTNRSAEAEPLFRRALQIGEQSYGEDHPFVATVFSNLACLLQDTNRSAEAEPLLRRAMEIAEQSYGEDHPFVATVLNNLAQLLKDTNRLTEAEPLLRRALEIAEQSYGKDHPFVGTDLSNLAQVLQATNRLIEAEPLLRRALEIAEQSYGKDHPFVARALNNLACLLQDTNRSAEAEPLLRRALEIAEQSYGKDHPSVANRLKNLALLFQGTNRSAEAEPLLRRALEITEQSHGKDHPDVANRLRNLALLLRETNRSAEAEPLLRRALEIAEQSYGKDHPNVVNVLNNLALLLKDTNRLAEAEPLMRRALAIAEQSHGKDHPNVVNVLSNLTLLLKESNRLAEADGGVSPG